MNLDAYIIDATKSRRMIMEPSCLMDMHENYFKKVCNDLSSILPLNKINAVYNYDTDTVVRLKQKYLENYNLGFSPNIPKTERYIGFYLSNIKAWDQFYNNSTKDYALIMKDEIAFNVDM